MRASVQARLAKPTSSAAARASARGSSHLASAPRVVTQRATFNAMFGRTIRSEAPTREGVPRVSSAPVIQGYFTVQPEGERRRKAKPLEILAAERRLLGTGPRTGFRELADSEVNEGDLEDWLTARPGALRATTRLHESPESYVSRNRGEDPDGTARTGSLYRAIRAVGNAKHVAATSAHSGTAPRLAVTPDGNLAHERGTIGQRTYYHRLETWPAGHHITAVDPSANEPVVRQVSGGDFATQYISTTKQLLSACRVSAYNWNAGERGKLRLPRFWGPVIHIDVSHLPRRVARLYDLSEEGPHRDALFREGEPSAGAGAPLSPEIGPIAAMAARDQEVLIEGMIPGSAIVQTYRVSEVMRLLADADRSFVAELRGIVVGGDGRINDDDREIIQQAGLLARVQAAPGEAPSAPPLPSSAAAASSSSADDEARDLEEARQKSEQRQRNASRKKSRQWEAAEQ